MTKKTTKKKTRRAWTAAERAAFAAKMKAARATAAKKRGANPPIDPHAWAKEPAARQQYAKGVRDGTNDARPKNPSARYRKTLAAGRTGNYFDGYQDGKSQRNPPKDGTQRFPWGTRYMLHGMRIDAIDADAEPGFPVRFQITIPDMAAHDAVRATEDLAKAIANIVGESGTRSKKNAPAPSRKRNPPKPKPEDAAKDVMSWREAPPFREGETIAYGETPSGAMIARLHDRAAGTFRFAWFHWTKGTGRTWFNGYPSGRIGRWSKPIKP